VTLGHCSGPDPRRLRIYFSFPFSNRCSAGHGHAALSDVGDEGLFYLPYFGEDFCEVIRQP